jgi:hypothetical protein
MTDTPVGVAGGLARDGAGASSRDAVEGFAGKVRYCPPAYEDVLDDGPSSDAPWLRTRVQCYVPGGGSDALSVRFGPADATFEIWTTPEGFEAIIGSLSAALARYRIACEAGPVEVPEEDIPW